MRKLFLLTCLVSCLSSLQAQKDSTHTRRHEFWVSSILDYFPEEAAQVKAGVAPSKNISMPGFRVGLNYNARLFKNVPGYFLVEAYYGRQLHLSTYAYNIGIFLKQSTHPDNDKFGFTDKKYNDCITLMLGYEYRLTLKKTKGVQLAIAAKIGLSFSLKEFQSTSYTFVFPPDSTVGSLYAIYNIDHRKGFDSCPAEFSLGLVVPIFKRLKMKIYFSYSQPILFLGNWNTSYYFFDVTGERIGFSRYSDKRNYLSFGMNLGF